MCDVLYGVELNDGQVTQVSVRSKHNSRSRRLWQLTTRQVLWGATPNRQRLQETLSINRSRGCFFSYLSTRRQVARWGKDLRSAIRPFSFSRVRRLCSPEHGFNDLHQVYGWVPAVRGAGEVSYRHFKMFVLAFSVKVALRCPSAWDLSTLFLRSVRARELGDTRISIQNSSDLPEARKIDPHHSRVHSNFGIRFSPRVNAHLRVLWLPWILTVFKWFTKNAFKCRVMEDGVRQNIRVVSIISFIHLRISIIFFNLKYVLHTKQWTIPCIWFRSMEDN